MCKTNHRGAAFLLTALLATGIFPQDFSRYDHLLEPQIREMPAQKMLVVEAKGDPNVAAGEAFSTLFSTFFKIKGARMAPPRARWLGDLTISKSEWTGLYALPLPETVAELPPGVTGARIETWEYGEVAEILHIGPYSEETPTIEKLHDFIQEQGYRIAGPHEEEYLRAPGMTSDPAEYRTIIRYQIRK